MVKNRTIKADVKPRHKGGNIYKQEQIKHKNKVQSQCR